MNQGIVGIDYVFSLVHWQDTTNHQCKSHDISNFVIQLFLSKIWQIQNILLVQVPNEAFLELVNYIAG